MAEQDRLMMALFRDADNAESAYKELINRGYQRDEISILTSKDTHDKHFTTGGKTVETGSKAAEGTGVGAALGGTVGAIVAAIAAIGTNVLLPGLGLVVAGPLAAALAGAGAGGATGGIIGALVGAGIPEEKAKEYETGLREGGIILGFAPRNAGEAAEVEKVWREFNGELMYR